MLFSFLVALMVILTTAFWVYQGFFSGLLMFFAGVISLMVAFAYFEPVNSLWSEGLGPGIGLPLAFMLLFLVSLLLLRTIFDRAIKHNVRLPVYLDRAGGGACGFFIGLTLVGSALVAAQMLPMGSSLFGFERLVMENGRLERKNLFFKPDNFAVGFAGMLSGERFGGENELDVAKPDYLLDLYLARANPHSGERTFVEPDSLRVKAFWETNQISDVSQRVEGDKLVREFTPAPPAGLDDKFLVARVQVSVGASKNSADIRFRTPQFRVVGPPPASNGASPDPIVYPAVGMSDLYTHRGHGWTEVTREQARRLVRFGPQTDFILSPSISRAVASDVRSETVNAYQFDVAFEVPRDFEPWYVEFKRGARVELSKKLKLDQPPEDASVADGGGSTVQRAPDKTEKKPKAPKVGPAPGGNVHVADAIEEGTGVSARLPFPLDGDESVVRRNLRGRRLGEGHFWVQVPTEKPSNAVTEFEVPEGKRMVQIAASRKDALSLFGKALSFAANVAAQIRVRTDDGRDYFAQGVYAAAPFGDDLLIEIQYWPASELPERCLKQPLKITKSVLTNAPPDRRLYGYIFIVDPGVRLVSFNAGSRLGGDQSLNITVPE